jgi:anti-sigma B factor antagonist
MQFAINDAGSAATIILNGRMDILGAEAVALPLATLSGSKNDLTVDMAGVSFIASIGLRHLVAAAKAIGRRGGRLVLLNPAAPVVDVITTSGLNELLPIETGGATNS